MPNIINHFEAFHDSIPIDLFAEDSAETTADGMFVATIDANAKGFDAILGIDQNNLQQIRNFAAKRWVYMDTRINELKCEGITLSAATLNLTSDNNTASLIANVVPVGCTDVVVWSSDNENVAAVMGGTVTACNNGTAIITAICGDYSATCTVTATGFESQASANLADITSEDWLNDKSFEAGQFIERSGTAVTNYIHIKVGDVLDIRGASPVYSSSGYAQHAVYDMNKNQIGDGSINTYNLERLGCVQLTSDGGVLILSPESMAYTIGASGEGYIRLSLRYLDGETSINLNDIRIYRNPNGENAEAWA